MTLNELVQAYDGDMLFDAREIELVRDENQERPIVSFDRNERNAIKAEILERPVENFRVEVAASSSVKGKSYSVTLIVLLGETVTPEPDPEPDPEPGS